MSGSVSLRRRTGTTSRHPPSRSCTNLPGRFLRVRHMLFIVLVFRISHCFSRGDPLVKLPLARAPPWAAGGCAAGVRSAGHRSPADKSGCRVGKLEHWWTGPRGALLSPYVLHGDPNLVGGGVREVRPTTRTHGAEHAAHPARAPRIQEGAPNSAPSTPAPANRDARAPASLHDLNTAAGAWAPAAAGRARVRARR